MPAQTKRFDGKVYNLGRIFDFKGGANRAADKIRKGGYSARVVKYPGGGYAVYTRGKTGVLRQTGRNIDTLMRPLTH